MKYITLDNLTKFYSLLNFRKPVSTLIASIEIPTDKYLDVRIWSYQYGAGIGGAGDGPAGGTALANEDVKTSQSIASTTVVTKTESTMTVSVYVDSDVADTMGGAENIEVNKKDDYTYYLTSAEDSNYNCLALLFYEI